MGKTITASRLYDSIVATHPSPEWAVFDQVANSTGSQYRRLADAVAMCLWPSRGMTIRGFEIKVDRQDLKRESKDPTKAEEVAKFCDEWWLVTPDGLVQEPELLPPAWGLMVPGPKGGLQLRVVKKAVQTEAAPLTRGFLAVLLRAANARVVDVEANWIRRDSVAEEIAKAMEQGKRIAPGFLRDLERDLGALRKKVDDFTAATGVEIDSYDSVRVSQAYLLGRALIGQYGGGAERAMHQVDHAMKELREARQKLKELLNEKDKEVDDDERGDGGEAER